MAANVKKIVLYGLSILLVAVLMVLIAGCKTVAPSTSPIPSGSPGSANPTTARQFPDLNGNPQSRLPASSEAPNPSAPQDTSVANVSSPSPSPSSEISTVIPDLSAIGAYVAAAPVILIVSPFDVSEVPSGDVAISTVVSNFNLVNTNDKSNVSGEGHIIYYMDVTPPTSLSEPATAALGTFVETTSASYTWHNVQPGFHYFSAQLVNNDSTPLTPAITVTIYVTVRGEGQSSASPAPILTPAPTS